MMVERYDGKNLGRLVEMVVAERSLCPSAKWISSIHFPSGTKGFFSKRVCVRVALRVGVAYCVLVV